jgi:predicted O-methyltransferase YrrM
MGSPEHDPGQPLGFGLFVLLPGTGVVPIVEFAVKASTYPSQRPGQGQKDLTQLTPGALARRLNGQRVVPALWANRQLIASTSGNFVRTMLFDRTGARYRLLGHLWLELQRFLAPHIRNVDLADLAVDRMLVEGDVSRHCRLVLSAMAKLLECRNVFEIGTYLGQTSWALAHNNPQAHVYTLDLPSLEAVNELKYDVTDPEYFVAWNRGIRFAGTPEASRITQLFGDSATFDFSPYRGKMDLVFIDGGHSEPYVRSDTRAALEMLSEHGTIVWDDYLYYPGIYKVVNELSASMRPGVFHIVGTRLAVYSRLDILENGWPAIEPTRVASVS